MLPVTIRKSKRLFLGHLFVLLGERDPFSPSIFGREERIFPRRTHILPMEQEAHSDTYPLETLQLRTMYVFLCNCINATRSKRQYFGRSEHRVDGSMRSSFASSGCLLVTAKHWSTTT